MCEHFWAYDLNCRPRPVPGLKGNRSSIEKGLEITACALDARLVANVLSESRKLHLRCAGSFGTEIASGKLVGCPNETVKHEKHETVIRALITNDT